MGEPTASATIEIAAPPEQIYAVITDLATFSEVASETETMEWQKGSAAEPGSVFAGRNSNGKRSWTTKCRVTDADGSRFAFNVTSYKVPVSRWQYEITATDGGCRVTESTWDRRPWWFKTGAEIRTASYDRPAINQRNIEATLERLKARAEG